MKLNTLRYLDRKIGVILCYLLYFIKKFFFWRKKSKYNKKSIKKILVIKIWGIGSIILASPLFQNLKKEFPNSEIWFLTQDGLQNIYPNKFFNHIETIKLRGFLSAVKDFLNLVIKFRKEKFDLVIDLELASRYTALLSYLSGAKTKAGFEVTGENKDKLYDYTSVYRESKHIVKIFLSSLEALGVNPEKFPISAPEIFSKDEQALKLKLFDYGFNDKYIIININASELALERRLPLDTQAKIIRYIQKNYQEYLICLTGSKAEENYVNKFVHNYCSGIKAINLAGKLNLREFFCLIKNSALMISNDSGTAHIAASFNVPLIVFFGPETPVVYAPQGEKVKIFYSDIYCSPCISIYNDKKINCKNNQKCLKKFDINEINQAVDNYLKK